MIPYVPNNRPLAMTDIFISYSHADEAWKNRLQAPLRALQLHNDFNMWDDRQIELGAAWLPAIEQAIAQAKVAVLLVSNDFLASEFVTRREIPKFLRRREQEGLRVVPLVVRPCPWQGVEWLAALQGATQDNKPLASLRDEHEIEAALSEVALRIYRLLQEAKRETASKVAEAERLERERLAREAEVQRVAEQKAARERETQRLAAEKAQQEAAAQREADLKRQTAINEQALKAQKQAINQQRIATLSEKLSKLYLQRDTETRVEEKFRLDALIQETEGELTSLGVQLKPYVAEALSAPTVQTLFNTEPSHTSEKTSDKTVSEPLKPLLVKIKNWLLGSVLLSSVGGFGVWWVEYREDEAIQPILPEMISIPAGTFTMGCVPKRDVVEGMDKCYDDELSAREVTVKTFQLAKTEVTVAQFRAFVEATNYKTTAEQQGSCYSYNDKGEWGDTKGNSWRKLGFKQADNDPVACVSWDDAQVYAQWLRKETGKPYRLPSEAEWEYAARAGSKTAYSWGSSIGKNKANCDSSCGDSYKYTAPVASYAANSYGLHDMHGNVWEWVADCSASYDSVTVPSTAVDTANCSPRVLRGGSWRDYPQSLRSADRGSNGPTLRSYNVGFRVASG